MNKRLAMKYERLEEVNNLLKSDPTAAIEDVLKWNEKHYGFIEIRSPYSFLRYFSLLLYNTKKANKGKINELLKIGGELSLVGTQGRSWFTSFPTDKWTITDPGELPQRSEYSNVTAKINKEEFLQRIVEDGIAFHLIINGVELFPQGLINTRDYVVEEVEYALHCGFLKNIENYYEIGKYTYVAVNIELKKSQPPRNGNIAQTK